MDDSCRTRRQDTAPGLDVEPGTACVAETGRVLPPAVVRAAEAASALARVLAVADQARTDLERIACPIERGDPRVPIAAIAADRRPAPATDAAAATIETPIWWLERRIRFVCDEVHRHVDEAIAQAATGPGTAGASTTATRPPVTQPG